MARHSADVDSRPHDVTHMWEIHKEILRTLVLGFRPAEIAQMFGVTIGFISNLRNSPLAQGYLETLEVARDASTAEVSRELMQTCPTAAKILKDVIDGKTDATLRTQIDVAKDWLSRSGFPKVTKTETTGKVGIDEETLDMLKGRAAKAKQEAIENNVFAEATEAEIISEEKSA